MSIFTTFFWKFKKCQETQSLRYRGEKKGSPSKIESLLHFSFSPAVLWVHFPEDLIQLPLPPPPHFLFLVRGPEVRVRAVKHTHRPLHHQVRCRLSKHNYQERKPEAWPRRRPRKPGSAAINRLLRASPTGHGTGQSLQNHSSKTLY